VVLATEAPRNISANNAIRGTTRTVRDTPDRKMALVEISVGEPLLLSQLTPDAVHQLQIESGRPVFALFKSIDIQVLLRAALVVEVIDGLDLSAMVKSYRGSGSDGYHPAFGSRGLRTDDLLELGRHVGGAAGEPGRTTSDDSSAPTPPITIAKSS
jgi:molybdopterin-binding protein